MDRKSDSETAANLGCELESLRREIGEIRGILSRVLPESAMRTGGADRPEPLAGGHVRRHTVTENKPDIDGVLTRLEERCDREGNSGYIAYTGVFTSGGRQSAWIKDEINADGLLRLVENRMAEQVLTCIGSSDRLNILLALLKKPMSVAQLVEENGYNSTGQVYHHLRPLITANLVNEDTHNEGKGTYIVEPHRVQGVLMILAGIGDLIDTKYSRGRWEDRD